MQAEGGQNQMDVNTSNPSSQNNSNNSGTQGGRHDQNRDNESQRSNNNNKNQQRNSSNSFNPAFWIEWLSTNYFIEILISIAFNLLTILTMFEINGNIFQSELLIFYWELNLCFFCWNIKILLYIFIQYIFQLQIIKRML